MSQQKVYIAYTEAGGGHKSVAQALSQHIERALPWQVVLVNPYRDMGPYVDIIKLFTTMSGEDIYNHLLKHMIPTYVPFQFFHLASVVMKTNKYLFRHRTVEMMARFWRRETPDLVVSVMPWINHLLAESLNMARPGVPLVTVMTDFDECTTDMWLSSPLQYLICGSQKAVERARRRGHAPEKVLSTSGLVIAPAFYEDAGEDRDERQRRLGLAPGVPTGLVMYGCQGASKMIEVARVMRQAQYPVQLIFMCGNHHETADAIRGLATDYAKVVCTYVNDVHRYLALADFFVGKPGPSSIAEALARELPMILDFDWRTMLQERYNAVWASENGAALLNRKMKELPDTVRTLLDEYGRYKSAARALSRGKAVFEVVSLLERCVSRPSVRQ